MNWIDYVIIGFLVLGILSGLRKGFILSVSNIACIIASVLIAKNYYKEVALFLMKNTALEDKTVNFLQDKNMMSGFLQGMIKENGLLPIKDSFTADVNSFASVLIINAISVVCIFLIVRFVLAIAEKYITGLSELPGVKELNRLGGGALGFAKSIIILLLVFAVITPLSTFRSFAWVNDSIRASTLAKYFYTYNFILGWIWSNALEIIK